MLRPSIFALSLLAALGLTGCGTIYTDMYSPRRSYFKPEKEKPAPSEVLPPTTTIPGGQPGMTAPPPVPPPAEQPPTLPGL